MYDRHDLVRMLIGIAANILIMLIADVNDHDLQKFQKGSMNS